MKKTVFRLLLLSILVVELLSSPPTPQSFAPKQENKPRIVLINIMKSEISSGVDSVITTWNRDYSKPQEQIMQLMKIFKRFSESPKMPIQLLKNETYQLKKVINTQIMITNLNTLQKQINITYHVLFDYASLLAKTKEGDVNKVYSYLLKEMPLLVEKYNSVARVTNKEYGTDKLPLYKLNRD